MALSSYPFQTLIGTSQTRYLSNIPLGDKFFNINKIKKNTFHFGDVDSLNGSIEEFNKIAPEELK